MLPAAQLRLPFLRVWSNKALQFVQGILSGTGDRDFTKPLSPASRRINVFSKERWTMRAVQSGGLFSQISEG